MKQIKISITLLLALAAFACSGGGDGSSPTSSSGQVVTVEIHDFEFSPKSIVIRPGQTVRWVRRGNDATHTTTQLEGTWDSGMVFGQDGASFERTFGAQEEGQTFNYSCTSHKETHQMQGSIRVGSSAPPPLDDY